MVVSEVKVYVALHAHILGTCRRSPKKECGILLFGEGTQALFGELNDRWA